MFGVQSGEFVCRYWGLKGCNDATINIKEKDRLFIHNTNQAKENFKIQI